jgi:hypothetical protein
VYEFSGDSEYVEAGELRDMQDIEAFWLDLYTLSLERVLPTLASDGVDDIRARPCKNRCRPFSFAGGSNAV